MARRLTAAEKQQIIDRLAAGDRFMTIAQEHGVSTSTVNYYLQQAGLSSTRRALRRERATERVTAKEAGRAARRNKVVDIHGTPDWMHDGACRGTDDPDAFYPKRDRDAGDAVRMCQPCPVRQTCLEWALKHREEFGVWGGLTEDERRELRRGAIA
ncbi:WhiB family transcriptional regulator [Intrasporangium flavum]|uniref:WhiB family transcriptional regulator n=1 Tax=Intrasporangium flavum TaxID=1428657 RepID=UPI001A9691D0|nr:WhiB family transcriptional regulator [Intrasporangium flavum]